MIFVSYPIPAFLFNEEDSVISDINKCILFSSPEEPMLSRSDNSSPMIESGKGSGEQPNESRDSDPVPACEENRTLPFLLSPVGKDYLWGGNRLNDDFSKNIDLIPLAETWECSTHPDGPSIVSTGPDQGKTLTEVLREHPEYIGTHPIRCADGGIPVLVKLIDAKRDLSVQVHPDDAYAASHENGALGKTEMWYIVDASKDAKLIYGFSRDMTLKRLKRSLEEGTVERYLQKVPVHKDDVFVMEPGTVHGIGEGIVLAEIQESSNLTYRLYDYNRVDKNGKKRELHIKKTLDVVNLKESTKPRQPIRVLNYKPGYASELLYRCRYFQVERVLINTERVREMADFQTDESSFQILLCVDGCGVIFGEGSESWRIFKGDCFFVPAHSQRLKLHGQAQFLRVIC